MANEVEVIPTTVDYTNRDYYSLREALIQRVKARVPMWQGTDANDFGVALVEAFSYMGDVTSYYIDRVANEMSLATASQRDSVINLSRMFGYNPSGYASATTTLLLKNSHSSDVVIPEGTQFYGSYDLGDSVIPVIFETSAEVTVPANNGTISVSATHGENIAVRYPAGEGRAFAGEELGVSNGGANQQFKLLENQVVDGTVRVFVERNTTYEEWTYVASLLDATSVDSVFTTYIDANNFVYVVFGDGITGKIPANLADVVAQYRVGGGSLGRVPEGVNFTLYKIPGVSDISALLPHISVISNTAGAGGSDPESVTSIRKNAPYALTTLRRAVTLDDYANITLASPAVGKANASASSFTSVAVYVAPAAEDDLTDPYPGYAAASYESLYPAGVIESDIWDSVAAAAEEELSGKTQIGVTATVLPPVYVPIKLTVKYTKIPNHSDADIKATMRSIIDLKYGYNSSEFGATMYPEDIETWLRYTPGITAVQVTALYRWDESASRRPVTASAGEILRLRSANAELDVANSNSVPSSITLSDVTGFTFDSATLTYTGVTTTAAATKIIVSAPSGSDTRAGVGSSIYAYNPDAVTPLALGDNLITVSVTSEDGLTTTTYTITINRS